jgi:hypothetical protein
MDSYHDRPGVFIAPADKVQEIEDLYAKAIEDPDDYLEEKEEYSSLASYIMEVFRENQDTRRSSGIEEKMLQSLRAYNGHYDPEDLARIQETGGSEIYMNLTPTKCRAAMSWLRDIMMPAKEYAWGLYPTDVPELPIEIRAQIEDQINKLVETPAPVEGEQQQQPNQPAVMNAAQKMQEVNQLKRDIEEAIADEIYKVALTEVKKYEKIVADQLQEGEWEKAFSEFIEDFCVFQVAIMKAPVISKKKRLTYKDGEVEEIEDFVFLNKRVSPLDIYPSANATSIQEGDLCEHVRFDRKSLYNLIGVPNYKEENIRKILEDFKSGYTGEELDSSIESEKVIEEYRGDTFRASKNIIHGVHFHGSIGWKLLSDWGFEEDKIGIDEDREFEVEAILAGGEVIKCVLNSDPLLRRPYYKASWQNIPGSFWGRSLPELMRDIQRMCNATARALANNMAVACLPGDTVVYRHTKNGRAYSEVTIKELFDKRDEFNSGMLRTRLRSLDENTGAFFNNKLVDVIYNGIAPVYEIKTESGYKIRATDNHRFLREDGSYDFVANFLPGDFIAVNGSTSKPTKLCIDCGCPIKPSSQRCKKCHTKYWNEVQRELARQNYWDASDTTSRQRKDVLEARKDYCKICGKVDVKFEVHHKNADPMDNSPENLINLCISCHRIEDAKRRAIGDPYRNRYLCFDKIISIEYEGIEEVYDLQMEAPNHNFVANGFVSHNSGPQIEVYVDRLADDSEIDDITPFHVWQLTSDPSGAGGRAITFWQPTSNAQELLAVYKEFEIRADDATGIPRYAYGNDRVGAAAQTASGLSMLLDSAAKGIKDSVRNIDFGLIKPRIEYQFYWNVISNDNIKFTGDVNVVPKGSEILTLKGASEMRRNEFLQILANPNYLSIVGMEGVADILREMAKTLGLGADIIPSRIELRKKQEEFQAQQAQQSQQQIQIEQQKSQTGLQATQLQIEGQMAMHQQTQELKAAELQQKAQAKAEELQLKAIEMQLERENQVSKETASLQKQQMIESNKSHNVDKSIALSVQTGDKSNIQ